MHRSLVSESPEVLFKITDAWRLFQACGEIRELGSLVGNLMEQEAPLALLKPYQAVTTLFTHKSTLRVRALLLFKVEEAKGGKEKKRKEIIPARQVGANLQGHKLNHSLIFNNMDKPNLSRYQFYHLYEGIELIFQIQHSA